MRLPSADFESAASASSAIPARNAKSPPLSHLVRQWYLFFHCPKSIGISSGVSWAIQCVSSIA